MRAHRHILTLTLALSAAAISCAQSTPRYLNPNVPIEQRIDDLLPRMTLAEKITQISNANGSMGVPRLSIPALYKTEAIHGQATSLGATLFPQSIALGATFDPALVGRIATVAGIESRAANLRFAWAPVINLARDVRWGRVEETYGESPFLTSQMGVAWIDAYQSQGLIAAPKHYAAHGGPLGGRDSNDVGYSDRVLREIYLPAFRAAIEDAHAGGIMPAYSAWQGVPDNSSELLLRQILQQEWGFNGIIVSDCGALENFYSKQGTANSMAEAAAQALRAGVTLNCGATYRNWAAKALDQGLITQQQLDDAVRVMLRAKFRLGLFDHPQPGGIVTTKLPSFDTPGDRALARQAAIESAVLLKNDHNLLPLSKSTATIAVIGPSADTPQTGDYSPKPAANQLVSVLAGIRSHVSSSTKILFAQGLDKPNSTDTSHFAEAVAAARQANVAVIVVGDLSHLHGGRATTGEGMDSATLALPGEQHQLIQAIQATGTPIVLVLVNGKPFTLPWEAEHIPAILETWFPGEEGGNATADLLFGDANPSGRLPITWPRSVGQLPLNYDYTPTGRSFDYADLPATPQWSFGYGLSYTQFLYSNLRIASPAADPASVTITADIENRGLRDGDEVAQLYITDVVASVIRPIVELKGIDRVHLAAGATTTVTFHLSPYDLSLLGIDMVRRVEPGRFRIHVGGVVPSLADPSAKNNADHRQETIGFTDPTQGITGEFTEPKPYAANFIYTLHTPPQAAANKPFDVTITVTNSGNLTDVTQTRIYAGAELGSWSFELTPRQSKQHTFRIRLAHSADLVLVAGSQSLVQHVTVRPTPPSRR